MEGSKMGNVDEPNVEAEPSEEPMYLPTMISCLTS